MGIYCAHLITDHDKKPDSVRSERRRTSQLGGGRSVFQCFCGALRNCRREIIILHHLEQVGGAAEETVYSEGDNK